MCTHHKSTYCVPHSSERMAWIRRILPVSKVREWGWFPMSVIATVAAGLGICFLLGGFITKVRRAEESESDEELR